MLTFQMKNNKIIHQIDSVALGCNMTTNVDKYFAYEHLPPHLQEVSKPIGELAKLMDETLPDGAEKSAGMRKLLEAKDCFVRAKLG